MLTSFRDSLRLKTSIVVVRWLGKQACTSRGHDELVKSKNRGISIEMIKHSTKFSKENVEVVLKNAPSYAKYTSSDIQNELLNILAKCKTRYVRNLEMISFLL